MVVSANTFFDGSVELPSPPKTGASISINRLNSDRPQAGGALAGTLDSTMDISRHGEYEEFRALPDRGSAESLRSWLEFEGVPSYVEPRAQETQFVVYVLKQLAHRARWIVAQMPPTDAELNFLATGKLPGQEEK